MEKLLSLNGMKEHTNILHVTYFDTAGSTAICTAFFNDKPVGVGSGYLNSGLAGFQLVCQKLSEKTMQLSWLAELNDLSN